MIERIRLRLREWFFMKFVAICICQPGEIIVGSGYYYGRLYIITNGRLLRYDPVVDEVQTEHHLRRL